MPADVQALALYFGNAERPLFGWWHAAGAAPLDTAVLLCPPYGREEVSAHRTLRHLAAALASAGLPVLRFDYAGTGDSAGDDGMPDLVDAWLQSVDAAVDELRRLSGAPRVAVVGLRLGALLGACAAARREDIAAFVALAPVQSGRSFVREQKALQAASAARGAAPAGEQQLEAGGYAMGAATCQALAALELRGLPHPPAPQALIIDRDDMPAPAAWMAEWVQAGCTVDHRRLPGYAALMQDPHNTQVPAAIIDATVQWLRQGASAGSAAREVPMQVSATLDGIIEEPVTIDADGALLHGVLSRPVQANNTRPAVLLVNAGAQRRIGPSRLYVTLARRWAAQGAPVLRLDLCGLGDSPARAGAAENIVYSPTAVAEVTAAVRQLRHRFPGQPCVAVGLCSGAYHGFKAAAFGAPLQAVVVINPLTFFWREGTPLDAPMPAHHVAAEMARYRSNLFAAERWRKLLRGQVDLRRLAALLWRRALHTASGPARDLARLLRLPLRDDLARELRQMGRARVALHFVFSQGDPGEDLLRTEGGSLVGRLLRNGQLVMHHQPDADHTFTGLAARRAVTALLSEIVLGYSNSMPASRAEQAWRTMSTKSPR